VKIGYTHSEATKIAEGDTLHELIFHQRRDVDKRSNAFQYRRNARYGSDRSAIRTDGSSGEGRIGEDGNVSGKSDMGAAYSESNRESTKIRDLQSNELSLEKVLFREPEKVGSRTTETLAPVESSTLKFSSATKEASSEDGVFFDGDNIDDDLGSIGEKPVQTVKDKLEARLGNLNTELNNVCLRLIGNIVYNYVLFGNSILTVS